MLGLKLKTDPRWVNIAEGNLGEILSDHAWCEQKAATNAIFLIINNAEKDDLVTEMTKIAIEEMEHFKMVHDIILERNLEFTRERKDDYVGLLLKFLKKNASREEALTDRLLLAAMIEARSCERFKVLSENIKDEELATFYRELMISEANHYTTFLNFARKYGEREHVDKRWKEWIEYEESIIINFGKSETIHG